MKNLCQRFIEPDVDSFLYRSHPECIVAEVRHHPVMSLIGVVGVIAVIPLATLMIVKPSLLWLWCVLCLALLLASLYWIQRCYMWRAVVTSMRVFAVSGITRPVSVMLPLDEIAEVTVSQPWWLKPVQAGHLAVVSTDGDFMTWGWISHPEYYRALIAETARRADPWPGDDAVS